MRTVAMTALAYGLAFVAMFLIFCEPCEDSAHWMADLLLSKAGGVAAGWAAWRLGRSCGTGREEGER